MASCRGSITGLAHQLYTNGKVSQTDVDKVLFLPAVDPSARARARTRQYPQRCDAGHLQHYPAGVRA
ncbi:hypothetical protein HH308_01415 [Gordonia sp. TBRC 11910]|uniref:Uncharacterized protein n=1 Tax=Gordonia asplenii TaxID=2725283 RepID=A0A848KTP2_9ACTN|nr:hypothetical protein [Gordonia asplenii]NMN99872.1 hypothetical protein [Gordonia asplenii]